MADETREQGERQEEARIEEPGGDELRIEDDPFDMEREIREFRRRNRFEDDFDDVVQLRRRRRAGGQPEDAARHGDGAAAAAAAVDPRSMGPIGGRMLAREGGRERFYPFVRQQKQRQPFPPLRRPPVPRHAERRRFDAQPMLDVPFLPAPPRMAEEDAFHMADNVLDRPEEEAREGNNQVISLLDRVLQPVGVPHEARIDQRDGGADPRIPLRRIREEHQDHNEAVRAERNRRMMELRERMIARRNENGAGPGPDNRQEAIADYMREMWDIRQGPMDAEIRARRAMDEERRRVHEAWARRAPQELRDDEAMVEAEAADIARQREERRLFDEDLRRMEEDWAEQERRRRRRIADELEVNVEMELAPRPAGERGDGQAAAMAEDVLRRQAEMREMRAAREEMLRRDEARHIEIHGLVDRMMGGAARWGGAGGVGVGGGARQQQVTEEMIATAARLKEEDDKNDPSPARFSRACSICVIANPRQRAVYSKCGHIVCYPCAVEIAKREEYAAKCPTCRATTGFVRLFESEHNDVIDEKI